MDSISLLSISAAAGGVLIHGEPDTRIDHISTDTRTIAPGSLFVALRGERFDGHEFIGAAAAKGATAVMAEEHAEAPDTVACIRVADTLAGLKSLAAWYRDRYDIPVIAVTGSTGKTSTKDMIAAMLAAKYETHKNAGNLNNEIGLSKTLFGLETRHQAAVVEMGMNHAGEINVLSRMAKPTAAVITNIGLSHIGNLGSRENILAAKLEILAGMSPDAPLVINGDDPLLAAAEKMDRPVIRCGFAAGNYVRAENIMLHGENGSEFTAVAGDARCAVALASPGRHSVQNCLCALGAALTAGVTLAEAVEGLKALTVAKMRFDIVTAVSGARIINDAYNASPDSVAAALSVLMDITAKRRFAVLGDMLEMGEYGPRAHYDTGKSAAQSGVDVLVAFGELSRHTARGAIDAGMDSACVYHCIEHSDGIDYLLRSVSPRDVVLIKGSRGMRMERIVEALVNKQP